MCDQSTPSQVRPRSSEAREVVTTVALLHGGSHGGWCWERVVPLLHERNIATTAPDLPMSNVATGARDWAEVVVAALSQIEDEVIVVGHSMAGLALPVIAAMRPVARMIFVAAWVPAPGMSYAEYLATHDGLGSLTVPFEQIIIDEQGRHVLPDDVAAEIFYHDVPPEDTCRAVKRLGPSAATAALEPSPIPAWPDVPSSYILMSDDRAVLPEWSRRAARERLGVEPVELPGGHCPFYSRPQHFADALAGLH
jgi:pimeloyl-ACP methyl ester carboxylesterase